MYAPGNKISWYMIKHTLCPQGIVKFDHVIYQTFIRTNEIVNLIT